MSIEIKNRLTGAVLLTITGTNLRGANLQDANLQDANLRGADLWGANLQGADLKSANLWGANLRGANLQGANLQGADLQGANLRGANLRGANLQDANLQDANLRGADLQGADLKSADLWGANLRGANLQGADLQGAEGLKEQCILPAGDLIGWKKLGRGTDTIVQLHIPAQAKRVNAYGSRKCRAEFAIVLDGAGVASHDHSIKYVVGKMVQPDSFDPDPRVECSHGIHFFITREEAEAYQT